MSKGLIKTLLLLILAFTFLPEATSQSIVNHNISYKYYPHADIKCRVKSCKGPDKTFLFFKIVLPGRPENFHISYKLMKEEINDRKFSYYDSLSFSKNLIHSVSNDHYLQAEAPTVNAKWIVVMIKSPQEEKTYFFDFPVTDNAGLLLFKNEKIPVFNNYISSSDTVTIKDFKGEGRQLNCQIIKYSFLPADPPAYTQEAPVNKTIKIDSSLVVR